MKQYTLALLASIACTSMAYGMNDDTGNQLFRDNSSPSLSRVELRRDIDFGIVITGAESLAKVCYEGIFKPATEGFIKPSTQGVIKAVQLTAPFFLLYGAACLIDPKPYNNK